MILSITGSRSMTDREAVWTILNEWWATHRYGCKEGIEGLVHGNAKDGVDFHAKWWAINRQLPQYPINPDYTAFPDWRRRQAPLARNTVIVKAGDALLAIWDGKSKGTKDTIDKALAMGKKVYVYVDGKEIVYNAAKL